MMTPSRVVRSLGLLGLIAWFGMVGWVAKSSRAQNGVPDDKAPSKVPPIEIKAPADPTSVTTPSAAKELAAPSAPFAPAGALDELTAPPPLPGPITDPTAPADEVLKAAAAVAPLVSPTAKPAAPAAPAPEASAAPKPAALSPSPMPIGRAAAVTTTSPIPVAKAEASAGLEDPESSARSFVERNAREAEEHLRALTAEAEELRGRIEKLESGIKQWEGVLRALKGSRHSRELPASSDAARSGADELSPLEPPLGRVAARPGARRNGWVSSEPATSPDGARPTAAASSEADPSPYLPPVSHAAPSETAPAAPASIPGVISPHR